jgi:hypothetical protein
MTAARLRSYRLLVAVGCLLVLAALVVAAASDPAPPARTVGFDFTPDRGPKHADTIRSIP